MSTGFPGAGQGRTRGPRAPASVFLCARGGRDPSCTCIFTGNRIKYDQYQYESPSRGRAAGEPASGPAVRRGPGRPGERKDATRNLENDLGEIRISSDVFTAITGSAATNCYGVKGMAVRSKTDGLVHLLKRESMAKGVKVYYNEDGTVSIELHIIVENGVNLVAVCRSIMSEVRYVVSKTTGVEVRSVDVFVDSMRF